ncbi:MAG TPA: CocE/NonD family hydrolase [bacterium]|nr:CocE/NonD family hydrolase [bacterium]
MKKTVILALLMAAAGLAGCATAVNGIYHLDPIQYRVRVEKDVMARMRDGTVLAADVYHPVGLDRGPVILVRTPYDKRAPGVVALLQSSLYKLFAGHGYTVVVQDVRGRYASAGEFYPMLNEARDGADTLQWLANEPWCNGKVGSWGGSYFGFTQWAMADADAGAGLAAMVPLITTADIIKLHYEGGAVNLENILSWSTSNRDGQGQKVKPQDLQNGYNHLPLITADNAVSPENVRFFDDTVSYRLPDVLADTAYDDRYKNVTAPALLIAGWYDLFQKYQIEDFRELREKAPPGVGAMSRIVIGPWGHGFFKDPPVKFKHGGIVKLGQLDLTMDFLDAALKGQDTGIENQPPYYLYVMGSGQWVGMDEWPPPEARPTVFYLHSDGAANQRAGNGALSREAPAQEPPDVFTYDPAHPVPTTGGPLLGNDAGPKDQASVEARGDVLVYTTAPLSSPLTVMGPLSVALDAASDALDTDFTAKLCDVYPDGLSVNIVDGVVRARFRDGDLRHPEPIVPGQVYEYVIDLWYTAYVFQPGHRIRLQISSSNFPRFDRNRNTGDNIATGTAMRAARQSVYHDAQMPSRLILSALP